MHGKSAIGFILQLVSVHYLNIENRRANSTYDSLAYIRSLWLLRLYSDGNYFVTSEKYLQTQILQILITPNATYSKIRFSPRRA